VSTLLLIPAVHAQTAAHLVAARLLGRRDQRGQASAEYALVLLGAAAVALLVVAWATKTNRVGKLLDSVMDKLLGHTS
jgi:ABC-type proline/glycine betaine transport system permease subunit